MPKYPYTLRSKLPNVGTTIFTVMSQLAQEQQALNLSQGFPNFPVSASLIELVTKYMKKGYNQYAPMSGVPELRAAISKKTETLHGIYYHPQTEITVTAGATQAIFTAIEAIVQEGDEVIVFTPAYDCYAPAIELNGGKVIYIPLHAPLYQIPWEELRKRLNRKTKMVIINSPHNPTGTMLSKKDLNQLAGMLKDSETIVLSDEVYEHITFDKVSHVSCASIPELAKRSLIVSSFGKTFHATGWKIGYIVGPENLMNEFRKVHQFNVFACNTPIQYALAEFINDEKNYLALGDFYQTKRDRFLAGLTNSRFTTLPSNGTYFQLLNYSNISKEHDTEIARKWTIEHKISTIPVSVFCAHGEDDKVLRVCFAKDDDTIDKACEILSKI